MTHDQAKPRGRSVCAWIMPSRHLPRKGRASVPALYALRTAWCLPFPSQLPFRHSFPAAKTALRQHCLSTFRLSHIARGVSMCLGDLAKDARKHQGRCLSPSCVVLHPARLDTRFHLPDSPHRPFAIAHPRLSQRPANSTSRKPRSKHALSFGVCAAKSATSACVGFCPSARRRSPSESRATVPVPFLSKSAKASLYSASACLRAL